MKLKLPHTSGYYVDEFDGSIWSDKSFDTLNQIKSTNSFYKSTRPNSQLKYVIAQRNHDQLSDSAANYLGFAKFDFDPRYHEVKVTSNNDLKPLANRIELTSTEQPLLSEFAKHAVIAKYYAKRTDGSFKYRTFQKANTAKDHWTLTVRNVIPGGRQSFDLWLSRDLLAGFASGKFTLELSPTVHPEIAEGSGSVFDRVQLVPGGCLDNQGIAWLIANRANNDFLAAANTGASGLRAITEIKSGDTVYAIFRNNVVIESLSKSYKVISLPGLHSQYVINQPKYRCINGWTRQEQLSEDVWDQIADLLSVEIPDDTDPNQFSNYDIINALESANEKFLGRVPAISDRKLSVETAKVINHIQRDRAQVAYQYERTADWDTLNRTLNYLDELGLTLSNYHEATLRVSASDDAYWKSRGVLADETLNQIKRSSENYLDNDKVDDEQCSDNAAVINEQTDGTKSSSVDVIVKSIYDIRRARKLKLKKKAKSTSINCQALDEVMDYAGITDYKVKFELPNNHLTVKAMISQELFKLCGFDQIVKKKQR